MAEDKSAETTAAQAVINGDQAAAVTAAPAEAPKRAVWRTSAHRDVNYSM